VERANLVLAFVLLLTIAAGMWRAARGPTVADRMSSALLFGTAGVSVLLLFAEAMSEPALRNVAMAFALLAAVVTVAVVRAGGRDGSR
jgi:multicomponent Na+:H+ antiporter subunit F